MRIGRTEVRAAVPRIDATLNWPGFRAEAYRLGLDPAALDLLEGLTAAAESVLSRAGNQPHS
jgi:hypothetical protein